MISPTAVLDPVLDGSVKGWPALGCRASELAGLELMVEDLPTPVLLIREPALQDNIDLMSQWCERSDVLLAPHAKTSMAPMILDRQLAAGAWGLTVADARQASVAIGCGASRVIIANEVVSPPDLRWLCEHTAESEVLFCLDSVAALDLVAHQHRQGGGPPLPVLLEVGYEDGRCGVRSTAELDRLSAAIMRSAHVSLVGVEGYEGLIGTPASHSTTRRLDAFLERLLDACRRVADLIEADEPVVTAGGSAYFDRVVDVLGAGAAELGWKLCLRSGCYVTHDHGLYERSAAHWRKPEAPRFQPALELRASVLSAPQPDRLILNCGRRDVSFDAGLPVVLGDDGQPRADLRVVALNDQHAHVETTGSPEIEPGEVLSLGISHPCTTLDRWRVIPLVDDARRVVGAVTTCF